MLCSSLNHSAMAPARISEMLPKNPLGIPARQLILMTVVAGTTGTVCMT